MNRHRDLCNSKGERILGWDGSPLKPIIEEKPEKELTAKEKRAKAKADKAAAKAKESKE